MKQIQEIVFGDTVIYKNTERTVNCVDLVENLVGLKPINEPEDIVWVRIESIKKI